MRFATAEMTHGVADDLQPATDTGGDITCCHDHDGSCVNCVSIPPAEVVAIATRRIGMFVSITDSPAQILLTLHYKPPRFLQI